MTVPAPPKLPPQKPGALPPAPGTVSSQPGPRVKFRHPDTGEETHGHVHGTPGARGATVVDGTGTTHRIPHGHYMHAEEGGEDGEKPSAEAVAKAARAHLELGPDQPLAVYAAAALLVAGGCRRTPVHELQVADLRFDGKYAKVVPDKLQTSEPELVKALQALATRAKKGPLFTIQGKPITEQGLTTYVRRYGMPTMGGTSTPPEHGPGPGAQPMQKAHASAMALPVAPPVPEAVWDLHGYRCTFHKGESGLGWITVEGPGMHLPLHEVVPTMRAGRSMAEALVEALRNGRTPPRGVYQRTRVGQA